MTVEEQKAQAKKEKETIMRVMIMAGLCKNTEQLTGKTLSQLKKMYEKTANEKWVFNSEEVIL